MVQTKEKLKSLAERFGNSANIEFSEHNGQLKLTAFSNQSRLEAFLQGAHVTYFSPVAGRNILWLSPLAEYLPGKAIRGGVPICWPWFGPCKFESGLPQHGLARTSEFDLISVERKPSDNVELVFELISSPKTMKIWPYEFNLKVKIEFGQSLKIEIVTTNTGDSSFELSQAIHTYFDIGEINSVTLAGLQGQSYLDQLDGELKIEAGPVLKVEQEVDRIYQAPDHPLVLNSANHQQVKITQIPASEIVIWNPWVAKSELLGDYPNDGYREMICVEAADSDIRGAEKIVAAEQFVQLIQNLTVDQKVPKEH